MCRRYPGLSVVLYWIASHPPQHRLGIRTAQVNTMPDTPAHPRNQQYHQHADAAGEILAAVTRIYRLRTDNAYQYAITQLSEYIWMLSRWTHEQHPAIRQARDPFSNKAHCTLPRGFAAI